MKKLTYTLFALLILAAGYLIGAGTPEQATPLTKKSSPGFAPRPPTPASLRPIEGPVGRSTLMSQAQVPVERPSSSRGIWLGLVAAVALAAAGFFGVKYFFGAQPPAPVHGQP